MVKYTISVCNYNMSETIEHSLRSILNQINDEFEVLVVDDGSTDDSPEIVESLQAEYDRLRLIRLPPDPGRHLGETRNIGVRHAKGDHVILQIDADDVYEDVLKGFVEIYERLRDHREEAFLLRATNLTVAPKAFLEQRGPYRNLPVGAEDLDMWRRLLAEGSVVWFVHRDPAKEIGISENVYGRMRSGLVRGVQVRTGEFQTGLSLLSRIRWSHRQWRSGNRDLHEHLAELPLSAYSYLLASARPQYDLPDQFKRKGQIDSVAEEVSLNLAGLEAEFGINRSELNLTDLQDRVFGSV
ncbi:glycosyltransferase family A protein [Halolamina salina]|uniref:Glycosyltransferase family A protein n=1 Tax=Halolamina salina TaxID=1220023 RepID=A0ABD6B386_9EURY